MIWSPGRRYIFIHMPKTGGTAMALALEARAMKDDVMLGDTPKARRRRHRLAGVQSAGRLWKHSTLADLDGVIPADEIDRAFVFTLVRNPWDRIVSYYFWLQGQGFDHPAVRRAQSLPFAAFLAHPATQLSIRRQSARDFTTDARGRDCCSACIRIEHLARDIAPLEAHLGFPLAVPRVNESRRERDWRVYYDADSADLLARLSAEDIARFGYGFDDAAAGTAGSAGG